MGCPALTPAETEASTSPSHRSASAVRRFVLPHADAQSRRSGPPRQHVPVAAPPKWPERRLPGTHRLASWSDGPHVRLGGCPKAAAVARCAPSSCRSGGWVTWWKRRDSVWSGPGKPGRPCRACARDALGLPRRPLPDGEVNTALEDASTSRRFSIDESVATHRRFQQHIARSSHGLCSPPRFPRPSPSTAGGQRTSQPHASVLLIGTE